MGSTPFSIRILTRQLEGRLYRFTKRKLVPNHGMFRSGSERSDPNGIRTRVGGMKIRCPRPTRRWGHRMDSLLQQVAWAD